MPPVALALPALLLAAASGASDAPVAFEVVRAPDAERCPDHDDLAARVAERLAASPRLPATSQVRIAIERLGDGHVATISSAGIEGGVRQLWDPRADCGGLAEALVLTLSMIADGLPVPRPQVLAGAGMPQPKRWRLGAGLIGSTGILGQPSLGLSLDGAWQPWPRITVGLSALWLPSRTQDEALGATRFTLVAGLARLCGSTVRFAGPVAPALCGMVGAGGLRGAGEGYADARSVWVPWLVAGGSLDLWFRVTSRLRMGGRAGYLFALRRESFSVGGVGQVHDGDPGWLAEFGASVLIR